MFKVRLFALVGMVSLAGLGCAQWTRPEGSGLKLAQLQPSTDATVLEITFLELPRGDVHSQADLWHALDEQGLSSEVRSRLASNGIRCGVAGMQLPPELRELLPKKTQGTAEEGKGGADGLLDPFHQVRQLQCRVGKRSEILTSGAAEQLTLLVNERGELRGDSYRDAQCLLAVRTFPSGSGRVKIELTPEIAHGTPKQQFASGEGSFRVVTRRESQIFEWLKFELELAPGQTLVVGPPAPPVGMGKQFFAADHASRGRLLLIRLGQPSGDALFDLPVQREPIATPIE